MAPANALTRSARSAPVAVKSQLPSEMILPLHAAPVIIFHAAFF
jgi:hypothetical protein